MSKGPITITISLALSVALVLPSMAVSAGRGGGGGMGGHGASGGHGGSGGQVRASGFHGGFGAQHGLAGAQHFAHGFRPAHSFQRPFVHPRPFFNRRFGRFFGFGAFASPAFFYGWPWSWPGYYGSGYDDSSSYPYDTSMGYAAPAAYGSYGAPAASSPAPAVYSVNLYNPAPAAPAAPAYEPPAASMGSGASGIVEYPGGRYELRGDGMTTPYTWVWIPNPPSGPPGMAPMRAPGSSELAPGGRGHVVYHWTDAEGVMHMTDRWEAVPQLYRQQAKRNLAS